MLAHKLTSSFRRLVTKNHNSLISTTMVNRCNYYSTEVMRSLLYVPGNSEKMLAKIHGMKEKPDVFVPDLEDSVPYHQKEEARKIVRDFLSSTFTSELISEYRMNVIPRVNSEDEFLEVDLKAITIPGVVKAVNIGKTSSIADVLKVDEFLTRIEDSLKIPQYSFKIIPSIESAIGLVHAYQICSCLPQRIIGVAFGGDDFAHDMGFTRDTIQTVEKEFTYVRTTIAVSILPFCQFKFCLGSCQSCWSKCFLILININFALTN